MFLVPLLLLFLCRAKRAADFHSDCSSLHTSPLDEGNDCPIGLPAPSSSTPLRGQGKWRSHVVRFHPDSLEMKMNRKAQTVFLNANVTIPCELSNDGSLILDISVTGVRWFLRRLNSDKEDKIFEYDGRKWTQFRLGANISMSRLRGGDASLFLPFIKLHEEGEYRCEIIIPPRRVQQIASLDIMAKPSSILFPPEIIVEENKTCTVECTVTGYYPEPVRITWNKVITGTQSVDVEDSEYIYKISIRNNDGTFNATSYLILHPVLEDNGTMYQCVVAHKSLLIPLQSSTTLTVADKLFLGLTSSSFTMWHAGLISPIVWITIVCILLVISLSLFGCWLNLSVKLTQDHTSLSTMAPVLSPLPETEYLKNQELKTFHFVIWHYRPKPLTLKFFLKISPKSEEELLISWRTHGTEREENSESMHLMETQMRSTLTANVQDLEHNFFGVSGNLTLVSDLAAFTEADLILQVEHSALKIPLKQKIHLKVIAQPKLKKIWCSSHHPQPGESVTLTCRIHSFFPRTVRVSWYKEDRLMLEGIQTSEAVDTSENGLSCSCTSKLEFSPQMEDIGKKFICKAEVEGSEPVQRHWVLPALGESP